jgi:hypothetical protein
MGTVETVAQPLIADRVRHSDSRLTKFNLVFDDIVHFLNRFLTPLCLQLYVPPVGKQAVK